VALDGGTISSYTQFSFSSSLTEFYQSLVVNFIKSFSIGLRFQADGILFLTIAKPCSEVPVTPPRE
jgi:hypothetical protein